MASLDELEARLAKLEKTPSEQPVFPPGVVPAPDPTHQTWTFTFTQAQLDALVNFIPGLGAVIVKYWPIIVILFGLTSGTSMMVGRATVATPPTVTQNVTVDPSKVEPKQPAEIKVEPKSKVKELQ